MVTSYYTEKIHEVLREHLDREFPSNQVYKVNNDFKQTIEGVTEGKEWS